MVRPRGGALARRASRPAPPESWGRPIGAVNEAARRRLGRRGGRRPLDARRGRRRGTTHRDVPRRLAHVVLERYQEARPRRTRSARATTSPPRSATRSRSSAPRTSSATPRPSRPCSSRSRRATSTSRTSRRRHGARPAGARRSSRDGGRAALAATSRPRDAEGPVRRRVAEPGDEERLERGVLAGARAVDEVGQVASHGSRPCRTVSWPARGRPPAWSAQPARTARGDGRSGR